MNIIHTEMFESYKNTITPSMLDDNKKNKDVKQEKETECEGCKNYQANQLLHMEYGGCLYRILDTTYEKTYEDGEETENNDIDDEDD
jgi:hypothetical protein